MLGLNVPDQEPATWVGFVYEIRGKLLGKGICRGFRFGERFAGKGNWLIWRNR